jgi:hypothetical protein
MKKRHVKKKEAKVISSTNNNSEAQNEETTKQAKPIVIENDLEKGADSSVTCRPPTRAFSKKKLEQEKLSTESKDVTSKLAKNDKLIIKKEASVYSNESYSNDDASSSSSISSMSLANDLTNVLDANMSKKDGYLFIELKLISIDAKCVDYKRLDQKFLCINAANSLTSHLQKFIVNKMNLNDHLFEVNYFFF